MTDFWRSFFGLGKAGSTRKVVGMPETIAVKDLPYVQDSNRRVAALQELCRRFRNTPYTSQVEAVYQKTRRIHAYLVSRNRGHELELFHLQHTDHFLNTFTVILNARQQHLASAPVAAKSERTVLEKKESIKKEQQPNNITRQPVTGFQENSLDAPKLRAPEVAIDTFSNYVYQRPQTADVQRTFEISYTSSPEEKETFTDYLSMQLGITGITYIGNTLVSLQNQPPETVPVIHWNGAPYVLDLNAARLYPVSLYRKK